MCVKSWSRSRWTGEGQGWGGDLVEGSRQVFKPLKLNRGLCKIKPLPASLPFLDSTAPWRSTLMPSTTCTSSSWATATGQWCRWNEGGNRMSKNSPHSASHCCDCRRKSLSGNWKTSVGQSILEEVPVQDKYRLWIDQVNRSKKSGNIWKYVLSWPVLISHRRVWIEIVH